MRLAALDVTGLPDSANAAEVVARLHGLLEDRLRFERLTLATTAANRTPLSIDRQEDQ